MTIKEIEEKLKEGQVNPQELAEMSDFLAGTSSSLMDRQLELQKQYADYFTTLRKNFQSDKAVLMDWQSSASGMEQLELETTQKKIKTLSQTIGRHLKVAHDQAYNRY